MKISMRMRYLRIEDLLQEKSLSERLLAILQEINEALIISAPDTKVRIDLGPKSSQTQQLLKQFEKKEKVLKILKLESGSALLKINRPKFDLLYEKIKQKSKKPSIQVFFTADGDLYREPKKKYCYAMGKKSDRYKIIDLLARIKGYQSTTFIAMQLGKDEKSIRTEIGKIRGNISKCLKIDGKDFLQGKKDSGYRINPEYKITFKK